MPEQLEKDELGRLGKIQNKTKQNTNPKTKTHLNRLLKATEVETPV